MSNGLEGSLDLASPSRPQRHEGIPLNPSLFRLARVVGPVCCLALLGVFTGTAAAATQTITFREVVKGSTFSFIDNAPKSKFENGSPEKISAGDQVVATSPLVSHGTQIGRERLNCVATTTSKSFEGAHFMCGGVLGFSKGTLVISVMIGGAGPEVEGAVTGGTGVYANARGTFVVVEGKDGSAVTVTLVE
jgi:hypothetical protein